MKIMFYALRPFDEQQYCEPYKARYGIDYTGTSDVPRPDNLHLAEGCDAVSTNPCEIRPEYLQTWAEMGVKYLPCRSIGYDHIPLDTAKKLGLRISHSHYPPDGVANYTIMLMLMCTRRMNEIMLRANVQDYSLPGKMGRDISGCTVGVIGTGKIGQTVIRHLSGFGCKILAYDLYPNDAVRQYADYVTLDKLYAQSDIITLHTNATAENHHLINAGALAKMKDGVLLVNTARGTLIDPDALIAGLESGKIGGAGLDVIEDETGIYYYNRMGQAIPNRELNLLRSYPNVIVSPHTAFYTDVNVASMVQSPFEALDAYAHGQPYAGEVQL
uniref:D-isomer specific 2-hydroxyacid dehydrogenase family protein n=1 Tax=Gemmiger formicilis TaxID=745368 RepID=UPI003FEF391D